MSTLQDVDFSKGKPADFPIKAVMTEKFIHLLDGKGESGRMIDLAPYAKVAMSDDGSTMAGFKAGEILVLSLDNRLLGQFRISDPQPVILPQHVDFQLSPNGKYLVVVSYFSKTITFHRADGELAGQHQFADLKGAAMKFSADGRRVVVHVPNWGEGKTSGYLVCFGMGEEFTTKSTKDTKEKIGNGSLLWRFEHKGCEAQFDVSGDGSAVALAAGDRLYSLTAEGKVAFEKPIEPGPMLLRLSGDGSRLAVARQADHSVALLDNRTGNSVWLQRIEGFDPLNSPFTSLVFRRSGNDAVYVAASKDWSRQNGQSDVFLLAGSDPIPWHEQLAASRAAVASVSATCCDLIAGDREARLYKL